MSYEANNAEQDCHTEMLEHLDDFSMVGKPYKENTVICLILKTFLSV
jgi:hypothetical protein